MKLWPDSFEAIKEGSKTIEMRLNDEKRKRIQIGDLLEFRNTETKEIMKCAVLEKKVFSSFKELYDSYDKISIGYQENEIANYEDMLNYYSKADIEKYGALAIHICKLELLSPKLLIDFGICPTCFDKRNENCLYGKLTDKLLYTDDQLECFFAGNPRAKGHTIISTAQHYKDILEAPKELVAYLFCFAQKVMCAIKTVFGCESVYLCTMCDGPMNHFHIQLIPRYKEEQRGSKNFVKERKAYIEDEEKVERMRKLLEGYQNELSSL